MEKGKGSDQTTTRTMRRLETSKTHARKIEKLLRGAREPVDQERPGTALPHTQHDLPLKQVHDQADGAELPLVHGVLDDVPRAEGAGLFDLSKHLARAEVDQAQVLCKTGAEGGFTRAGAAWM